MERTMSVEEKIKRAEEIYARRQAGNTAKTATVTINSKNKKDIKLLKKMFIQILISLAIYLTIYIIQNNSYIFSEDFIDKVNQILSYDMNIQAIYDNTKQNIQNIINNMQHKEQGIRGTQEENTIDEVIQNQENISNENDNNISQEISALELSQEEQDISNIKATTSFIKPVEGTISSKYGQRNPTTNEVPTNHTGIDLAANIGTKIISSTDGEVVLASEEGDYGKHLKIQIGEISIIYAHCNNLYVKQGDIIKQGQEIAEVGSTGNSTGPHLHFEIRISERTIDPEKILEL